MPLISKQNKQILGHMQKLLQFSKLLQNNTRCSNFIKRMNIWYRLHVLPPIFFNLYSNYTLLKENIQPFFSPPSFPLPWDRLVLISKDVLIWWINRMEIRSFSTLLSLGFYPLLNSEVSSAFWARNWFLSLPLFEYLLEVAIWINGKEERNF